MYDVTTGDVTLYFFFFPFFAEKRKIQKVTFQCSWITAQRDCTPLLGLRDIPRLE